MSRVHWFWWVAIGMIVSVVMLNVWILPGLPEKVPTHWNIKGDIDAYGSKSTLWLMPGMMVGMFVIFAVIPLVSPKPFDLDSTKAPFRQMMLITVALMGYIQLIVVAGASGTILRIDRILVAGICLFMALMGNLMGKIKRNLYMGIRTPWTIANDRVWADTHRLAAWLFVAAGLSGILISLFWEPIIALAPIFLAAIGSVVYSYVHYKRLERSGGLE